MDDKIDSKGGDDDIDGKDGIDTLLITLIKVLIMETLGTKTMSLILQV